MGRIRTIKPEFPHSETMGKVSREARLLFVLLWTIADDSGRARANSRMLASLLYPYDDDAKAILPGWLDELEDVGAIRRYIVDDGAYLEICKWLKHQKIDKPSASKHPGFDEGSPRIRETSPPDMEGKGRDQGEEGKGSCTSATPTRARRASRETPAEFLDFKLAYPERAGDQGWRSALGCWNARIREGCTPAEMIAGAKRYAAYCAATDATGTQFVKTAKAFLGPEKHFLAQWQPPAAKAERQQSRNVSASVTWLEQQEKTDAA